jgi:lysophospholipase L1-like esterase
MYPPSRVFAVLSFAGDFSLPQPANFIRVSTAGGDVDADADALGDVGGYSAYYTFTVVGGNNLNILCPAGWTTPSGTDTTYVLPGNFTYGILYDREHQAITLETVASAAAPVNTVAPVASGAVSIGGLLSTTNGTWSGAPTSYTYQWQRNGVDILGATASTYTPVAADITPTAAQATTGPAITCVVTAHNIVGATDASSNALSYDPIVALGAKLKAWWRGDGTVAHPNTVVSSAFSVAADQSGHGWNLQQQTAGNRPNATRTVNGMTVFDFVPASNQFFGGAGCPTWLNIFGAVGPVEFNAFYLPDAFSGGSADSAEAFITTTSGGLHSMTVSAAALYQNDIDNTATLKTATSGTAPATGTMQRFRGKCDNSTQVFAQVDAGAAGTTAFGTMLAGSFAQVVKVGINSGNSRLLDGALGEMFATTILTTSESDDLGAWGLRWSLSSGASARVMACGDSITYGYQSLLGGWRPRATQAVSVRYAWVGPYDSYGLNRGVSGEKASDVAGDLAAFAAELVTYAPDVVVLAWGTNDLGNGGTVADYETNMNAIIDQVQMTLPLCKIVVQSIVEPTSGPYFAHIANYVTANTTTLPAICAAQGCTFADVGTSIVTSDGVHPVQGDTGYNLMAQPTANAIGPT